jgi:hypothetical protein
VAGKRSNSQPVASPVPEHGTPCAFAQVLEAKVEESCKRFEGHETEQNGQIKRIVDVILPGIENKLDHLMYWIIGLLVTILGSIAAAVIYILTHWPGVATMAG